MIETAKEERSEQRSAPRRALAAQARRYETLDALRGVAAPAVVVFHLGQVRMEGNLVPHGYLAVDFFFVLSGFVVGLAYEGALREGLSWQAFFVKRVIRLYPLALLGAVMGLLVLLMKWHSFPGKVDSLPRILVSGFFNCLMLPTFFGGAVSRHELFPGNGPLWTLFFEMAINLFWAWAGVRLRTWALAVFAAASFVVLAVLAVHFHTVNLGFDMASFLGGLARVCFGFPLGVVLYRLHLRFRIPSAPWVPAALAVALVAVLASGPAFGTAGVAWYDLVCVLVVLPAIVVLGIGQGTGGRLGDLLGSLSYPVYVLHFPLLLIVSGLHQTKLARMNVHLLSLLALAAALLLGAAVLRFFDEPVRRRLSRAAARRGLLGRRLERPNLTAFSKQILSGFHLGGDAVL